MRLRCTARVFPRLQQRPADYTNSSFVRGESFYRSRITNLRELQAESLRVGDLSIMGFRGKYIVTDF